jgi:hypothetical protein
MMNKSWTLPVEEVKIVDTDEVEYFVTFPQDMLEYTGWIEGDVLDWIDNGDGSFTMKKQEVTESGNV